MNTKFIDMTGKVLGSLTVLRRSDERGRGGVWVCRCECGTEVLRRGDNLRSSKHPNCGCEAGALVRTHGKKGTKIYRIWRGIKDRCCNERCAQYHRYGGRGIQICETWRNSFQAFYDDMGDVPESKHSIERIDNDRGYCKSNCRWASMREQSRNKCNTHRLTFKGKTRSLSEWADKLKIPDHRIRQRINRGWSVSRALTVPSLYSTRTVIEFDGRSLTIGQWARHINIHHSTLLSRLREGWSVHRSLKSPLCKQASPRMLTFNGRTLSAAEWSRILPIGHATILSRLKRGWTAERTLGTVARAYASGKPSE